MDQFQLYYLMHVSFFFFLICFSSFSCLTLYETELTIWNLQTLWRYTYLCWPFFNVSECVSFRWYIREKATVFLPWDNSFFHSYSIITMKIMYINAVLISARDTTVCGIKTCSWGKMWSAAICIKNWRCFNANVSKIKCKNLTRTKKVQTVFSNDIEILLCAIVLLQIQLDIIPFILWYNLSGFLT